MTEKQKKKKIPHVFLLFRKLYALALPTHQSYIKYIFKSLRTNYDHFIWRRSKVAEAEMNTLVGRKKKKYFLKCQYWHKQKCTLIQLKLKDILTQDILQINDCIKSILAKKMHQLNVSCTMVFCKNGPLVAPFIYVRQFKGTVPWFFFFHNKLAFGEYIHVHSLVLKVWFVKCSQITMFTLKISS